MEKIKPCPFCGKDVAELSDVKECEDCANFENEDACPAYEEMEPCPWHFVVCSHYRGGCGASGGWELTEEKAIEAWNRRV